MLAKVKAVCQKPKNNYSFTGFDITYWGTFGGGGDQTPEIRCNYKCKDNPSKLAHTSGAGSFEHPTESDLRGPIDTSP